jgi:glycosyltransferase involved in cell wall biosynthesis
VVLPSRYEPFGGAAAEGLAMGLPVLVSDETGSLDLVTAGQNGVILPTPMTPERIRTAFQTLQGLIEAPVLKPADIRDGARSVANDVILDRLMTEFIEI